MADKDKGNLAQATSNLSDLNTYNPSDTDTVTLEAGRDQSQTYGMSLFRNSLGSKEVPDEATELILVWSLGCRKQYGGVRKTSSKSFVIKDRLVFFNHLHLYQCDSQFLIGVVQYWHRVIFHQHS